MSIEEGKHVMLSYQWNSQKIVSKIYDILVADGIKVWMDIKGGMKDDKYNSMAEGIEDAAVLCCFLTPDYQKSPDCERELKQAADLVTEYTKKNKPEKLRIISCVLVDKNNPKWKPSGWLHNIIAGKLQIRMKDDCDSSIELVAKELINRIKNQPLAPTKESIPSSVKLFEPIRQKYLRENKIKRLVNETKSVPIEQSYINLAIVETKEQQEKENKLKQHSQEKVPERENEQDNHLKQHNNEIIGTFEEIYGIKTSMEVKSIFEKCKGQKKKVLVLGRAGIGKSTFCQYVTYRWAKGEIWSEYDLVVLIRLRKLRDNRYPPGQNYSPVDLVKKEYFPFDDLSNEEKQRFKEQCNIGKVLWILDGYDEFVQNIPEQLKDAFDYILETQHHILTSRPYAITLSYDVEMEITGFTDDNIVKYVEQFFDQIKDEISDALLQGQKLLNFSKSTPSIWGIAHIPVNLELICSLWGDADWPKNIRLTMTTLYDHIIQWLCRRHLEKSNIDLAQKSKKRVYNLCDKELQFLENLAFNAMESNQIILPPTLLENTEDETKCYLDDHPQILNFGILKSYDDKPTGNQTQAEKQHYFIHLSFQEHFAARHLLKTLKSSNKQKAINFINNHKYEQRFQLVFIFASGLLAQSDYISCMDAFWATIQGEPLDLIGLKHIKLIIECVDELGDQTVFRQRAHFLKAISHWLDICVRTEAFVIQQHLLQSLQRTNSALNRPLIRNKLIELMTTPDTVTKRNVFYLISQLTILDPTPKLLSTICAALRDEDLHVRGSASEALGKMGEKAATNEVITGLLNALRDEDSYVRMEARKVLVKMGGKAATHEVIAGLLNALRDDDSYVRFDVTVALGKMGQKAATNEVIAGLLNALRDKDSYVRSIASEALGDMGQKAATNEVITGLLNALQDKRVHVRESASEALGKMGEKAATNEVISGLLNALRDKDSHVRKKASEALVKIGEKAATNEVIAGLLNALRDEDSYVRMEANAALVKMGEKAATNEVIASLLNALPDRDLYVRPTASEALGKMGEKAPTNEVIVGLLNTRQDEDSDVRSTESEALGKMGEKSPTNEVITGLLNALRNKDSGVRKKANAALGKMGEKAATNEVITGLVNALRDENSDVRSTACAALQNMGEKAATNEVIAGLLNALRDEDWLVRRNASEALGNMGEKAETSAVVASLLKEFVGKIDDEMDIAATDAFEGAMCSYRAIKELDSNLVLELNRCLRLCGHIQFTRVAPDQFIRVFLETKNDAWLPVIRYAALLHGIAVTVVGNDIKIHDAKRVFNLKVALPELIGTFVKGVKSQERDVWGDGISVTETEDETIQ